MKNNLLLARFTGGQPCRTHAGRVSTPQRNQRWCSDGSWIVCDNGERVRTIFALDTCDREVMAFPATTDEYSADMVQGVMLACVEKLILSSLFRIFPGEIRTEEARKERSCTNSMPKLASSP